MSQSPRMSNRSPSLWQVLRSDMSSIGRLFTGGLTPLVDWLFAFNAEGARRRWNLFILITLLLWFGLAMLAHPLGSAGGSLLSQFFYAIFAADVVRHLIILALALWLGLRMASIYMDDIFELDNIKIAENFIRSAAFSGSYQFLVIRGGQVSPAYLESPVFRIGGPGRVDVHLENAALFEKIDGTPHVLRPTSRRFMILDGFERLRSVIDLRDQYISLTVEGRTQDGIPVSANDVRLVYSVYRGAQVSSEPDVLQQPYPFTDQAIKDLVYKQSSRDILAVMAGSIRNEMNRFISRHTLSDFLVNAAKTTPSPLFVHRDKISDLFYDYEKSFAKRAIGRGMELYWIGIGTWVTPSDIIPERNLRAWELSCEARIQTGDQRLSEIRRDGRLSELVRFIDELIAKFYNLSGQKIRHDQVIRLLIKDFRDRFIEARKSYLDQNQPVPPEIEEVIKHLNKILGRRPGKPPPEPDSG